MGKITAEELRIGNLLFFKNDDEPGEPERWVSKVDADLISHAEDQEDGNEIYLSLSRIPLDDKMLEILGCRKATDGLGGYLTPAFGEKKASLRIKDNQWYGDYGNVELNYVHQLQNLFFVLSNGQELPHPPVNEIDKKLQLTLIK